MYFIHPSPLSTPLRGRNEGTGCNCYSSSEAANVECIMPKAYGAFLEYFDLVAALPGYEEIDSGDDEDEDEDGDGDGKQEIGHGTAGPRQGGDSSKVEDVTGDVDGEQVVGWGAAVDEEGDNGKGVVDTTRVVSWIDASKK